MPDAIFAHSRLALVYDEFEGDRSDLPAYIDIADELNAELVLDIGCGTGSLAILLARTGRTVVAVDPAEASLRIAKAKDAPSGWLADRGWTDDIDGRRTKLVRQIDYDG